MFGQVDPQPPTPPQKKNLKKQNDEFLPTERGQIS